ncbi:hypothetical protein BYT27DRAFT_7184447 [Phlegmacium glaucopus]|nr:hypothetical protein BYT27DRAFT_7184447 [Phlegmacium glaucopus]
MSILIDKPKRNGISKRNVLHQVRYKPTYLPVIVGSANKAFSASGNYLIFCFCEGVRFPDPTKGLLRT